VIIAKYDFRHLLDCPLGMQRSMGICRGVFRQGLKRRKGIE
jgi:hypothetical protein